MKTALSLKYKHILLLQQNRIRGFNLSWYLRDTNHVFGNKHVLLPWKFPIPNRTVTKISPAVQWNEKLFSGSPSELRKTQHFFASPNQSDSTRQGELE